MPCRVGPAAALLSCSPQCHRPSSPPSKLCCPLPHQPHAPTLAHLPPLLPVRRADDKMSARELFRSWGVSQRCYEEFLKPTLLVGLFAPPEEISAATMVSWWRVCALGGWGLGGEARDRMPPQCSSLACPRRSTDRGMPHGTAGGCKPPEIPGNYR